MSNIPASILSQAREIYEGSWPDPVLAIAEALMQASNTPPAQKAGDRTLKPCPFCGSRNVAHGLFGGDMIVKCIGCFSGGPPVDAPEFSDMVEKRNQAVAAWNRRADDPQSMNSEALAAHIAELQQILREKQEVQSW